eukprot:4045576-Prorocentrum_lima.AAC.1
MKDLVKLIGGNKVEHDKFTQYRDKVIEWCINAAAGDGSAEEMPWSTWDAEMLTITERTED